MLTGGAGSDRFVFEGQYGTDRIVVNGYGGALDGFDDLAGRRVQAGADVRVNPGAHAPGAGVIVLQTVQFSQAEASDFVFTWRPVRAV